MGRDGQDFARINESLFIKLNNPTLNSNIGKYTLPHISDGILFNNPGLETINWQEHHQQADTTSLVLLGTSRTYKVVDNIFLLTWCSHSVWLVKACLQVSNILFMQNVKETFINTWIRLNEKPSHIWGNPFLWLRSWGEHTFSSADEGVDYQIFSWYRVVGIPI